MAAHTTSPHSDNLQFSAAAALQQLAINYQGCTLPALFVRAAESGQKWLISSEPNCTARAVFVTASSSGAQAKLANKPIFSWSNVCNELAGIYLTLIWVIELHPAFPRKTVQSTNWQSALTWMLAHHCRHRRRQGEEVHFLPALPGQGLWFCIVLQAPRAWWRSSGSSSKKHSNTNDE